VTDTSSFTAPSTFGQCLYWVVDYFNSAGAGYSLRGVPTSGGTPVVLFNSDPSASSYGYRYAVDASGFYWVDWNSGNIVKATK
jgi:hypothetical protein